MALTGEQWHLLATGGFTQSIRAFSIDPTLSVRLGVGTVSVWIRPDYVQKIRFKHRTPPELFEHIPAIAKEGEVYLDNRDPFCLVLFLPLKGKRYCLVLKGVPHVNEIWVSTFYYMNESEYRRRTRKMTRIRDGI